MKGEYFGQSSAVATAVCLTATAIIMVSVHLDCQHFGGMPALLTTIITMIALLELNNLPCYWATNEQGFTITMFGKDHYFRYDELENVSCEYLDADKYGNAYARLTIESSSGKKRHFVENIGEKLSDISNGTAVKQSQLMQLCDYVNRAMGETAK